MPTLLGDDLYPDNPDIHTYCENEKLDGTLEELTKSSRNLHRWYRHSVKGEEPKTLINIPGRYGQSYSAN